MWIERAFEKFFDGSRGDARDVGAEVDVVGDFGNVDF